MEKMGTEAMAKACKKSFFVGFERCRSMVQAFLPNNHAKLLRTNPSYESLKDVVNDYVRAFAKSSEQALSASKFHATTQIDPKVHSEENKAPTLK